MARDRRTEILDVARDVFLEQGYAAASMSTIAARLGGSKGTLYNYFENKEELFRAHIQRECALSAENIFAGSDQDGDIEALLKDLGARYLAHLTSEDSLRNIRVVVAEAERNPDVARQFYEAGPAAGSKRLAGLFERAAGQRRLKVDNALCAAHQFLSLCKASAYSRRLFAIDGPPTQAEIRADVAAAVHTFMKAYGPNA